jgi:hypothetical protein
MPSTYTLIASNVLSSSAASVTFSAIPGTFNDLVVKISARDDQDTIYQSVRVQFNADTSAIYSLTDLRGSGTSALSQRFSALSYTIDSSGTNSNNATANTFSNAEIYIPNYISTTSKSYGSFAVAENNATAAGITAMAGLFRNTSAITTLRLQTNGGSFVSGSSFYLYGIKNS